MNSINELWTQYGAGDLLTPGAYLLNIGAAFGLGLLLSLALQFKRGLSKSFAVTLAVLPPTVAVVIMMVNGSIGAGVAVAGAFSLVRFRSVPGSGREIMAVFIAMAIGLTCAMGNLSYALIFTGPILAGFLILEHSPFGEWFGSRGTRTLKITIPEDLDYSEVFEDLFDRYARRHKLMTVKTTNMGSLFKLDYQVEFKDPREEKEFLDQLRVRNGNLEISCSTALRNSGEL
ncbi:MAG: DUF4956 domain-containing protein [Spirochaetales bacterium]|nr:DUF4956 domain-containing protein [Spirochaetales bacterium]